MKISEINKKLLEKAKQLFPEMEYHSVRFYPIHYICQEKNTKPTVQKDFEAFIHCWTWGDQDKADSKKFTGKSTKEIFAKINQAIDELPKRIDLELDEE